MSNNIIINEDYYKDFIKKEECKNIKKQDLLNKKEKIIKQIKRLKNCLGIEIHYISMGLFVSNCPIYLQCKHLDINTLKCKLDKENRKCNSLHKYTKGFFGLFRELKCDYKEMIEGLEYEDKCKKLKKNRYYIY